MEVVAAAAAAIVGGREEWGVPVAEEEEVEVEDARLLLPAGSEQADL